MADGANADDKTILMATVGAPHGVRGAVKLTVFAEDPLSLRRYNPFLTGEGATLKLARIKPIGKALVGEFDGIGDRNAAETLRGTELYVPRQRLPRPDDDEYYHVDLIGLAARTLAGEPLGHVRAVNDYGAGDILEIAGDGGTVLVPFTRAIVPTVDLAAGLLTVDPPAGLLDDEGDDGGPDDEGSAQADTR
ncbi:MAG: ribosome maturation factor RimM [Acuticoccus sp.]